MIDKLKALKIEEKILLTSDTGQTGYVKRKSRTSYCLFDDSNKLRSRWGRAAEIVGDIEHFITYGKLPPPCKEQWF